MLRIDDIQPAERPDHYLVTYSLSPVNVHPVWRTAAVPTNYGLLDVDWMLRNHWAQVERKQVYTLEELEAITKALEKAADKWEPLEPEYD